MLCSDAEAAGYRGRRGGRLRGFIVFVEESGECLIESALPLKSTKTFVVFRGNEIARRVPFLFRRNKRIRRAIFAHAEEMNVSLAEALLFRPIRLFTRTSGYSRIPFNCNDVSSRVRSDLRRLNIPSRSRQGSTSPEESEALLFRGPAYTARWLRARHR